jgi:(E)-4-hydroxy-3-methylbut-2-enyl-diphosphate synthase
MEKRLSGIKAPLTVAIMGCVVNGPGEAQGADIALVGGTEDYNFIYIGGEKKEKVKKHQSADALETAVRKLLSNLG